MCIDYAYGTVVPNDFEEFKKNIALVMNPTPKGGGLGRKFSSPND